MHIVVSVLKIRCNNMLYLGSRCLYLSQNVLELTQATVQLPVTWISITLEEV